MPLRKKVVKKKVVKHKVKKNTKFSLKRLLAPFLVLALLVGALAYHYLPDSSVLSSNVASTPLSSRVFITNSTYQGNMGGLVGADAKCQASAEAAKLGGKWKAWLSDQKTSAASRLVHSDGPYVLLNGVVVANNWQDLVDKSLLSPINLSEENNKVENPWVWTGTLPDGSIRQADDHGNCSNWLSTSVGGTTGDSRRIDGGWSDYGAIGCQSYRPIYCIEQVQIASSTPSIVQPTNFPTLTPSVSQDYPDLALQGAIRVAPASGTIKSPVNVMFTIVNKGTVPSRAYYQYTDQSDGYSTIGKGSTCANYTVLNPGQTCVSSYDFTFPTTGTKTMTIVLDPNSEIKESNESNNKYSTRIAITTPTPAKGKLPPCDQYGDVNGDGYVTEADVSKILRYVAGLEKPSTTQFINADVDGNGKLTSADALLIRSYVNGSTDAFIVCKKPTPTKTPAPTKIPTPFSSRPIPCGRYGDLNYDRRITTADMDLLKRYVVQLDKPSSAQLKYADLNGSGTLTSADIAILNAYLQGRLSTFPVCTPTPTRAPTPRVIVD